MSQLRWAVGNTVSELIGPRFKPQIPRSKDERIADRPFGRYRLTNVLIYWLNALTLPLYKRTTARPTWFIPLLRATERGGRRVQWPRAPWTLGGPWGGPMGVRKAFFGDHLIIRTKMRHFFHPFWSSQTGNPSYLNWPRAHVRLSVPLPLLNYICYALAPLINFRYWLWPA